MARCEDLLTRQLDHVIDYSPRSFVATYFNLVTTDEGRLVSFSINHGKIDHETALCGYFTIITSARMSASDALILYKNRDESEKLYRSDKSFLGGRSMRVHHQLSLNNKLFIAFVTLIIRSWLHRQIIFYIKASNRTCNWLNIPPLIKELEKITVLRNAYGCYRLNKVITRRNREVLTVFGIDESQMTAKLKELSDDLFDADQAVMRRANDKSSCEDEDTKDKEEDL